MTYIGDDAGILSDLPVFLVALALFVVWFLIREPKINSNHRYARATKTCYVPQATLRTRVRRTGQAFLRTQLARTPSPRGWSLLAVALIGAFTLWAVL